MFQYLLMTPQLSPKKKKANGSERGKYSIEMGADPLEIIDSHEFDVTAEIEI